MTPTAAPTVPSTLTETWVLSDDLFTSIPPEHRLSAPISLRNPFIFYFGHLPAFTINTLEKLGPLSPIHPAFQRLFSRGRDPDTDDPSVCHPHPPAPPAWPPWHDVLRFRDDVRATVARLIRQSALPGSVVRLLAEHEVMHVETLYYMLAQMNPHPMVLVDQPAPPVDWITVPAGDAALGRPQADLSPDSFAWDNEFHPATPHLPEFRIMRHAVSIASFKAFVDAGGYRDAAFWLPDDWAWMQREGMRHPASWRLADGVVHVLTNTGPTGKKCSREVATWPVSVSLAEARAYARWAGGEIPTEAQWMRAAGSEAATWEHHLASAPVPVHRGAVSWCGVVGMVGNGWELTESVFDSFEGFQPTELYPEYSVDFFDGKHFVLKGASWATHPICVRPTFRNYYQARYPYVFSKFRLVRSGDR